MRARRGILAALALACAACGGEGDEGAAAARPNVLLIVADDLGWNDVGYHGSEIATPRLDAFVAEGVELDRFRVQPQCTPTRAGLLTGRHPLRFGMQSTVVRPWDTYGLPADETTLAEVLGAAGYPHRALFGKWHLGHGSPEHHPLAQGFTSFYGHFNGRIGYFDHARGTTASGAPARDWHRDHEPVDETGRYATELTAAEAVRFLRARGADREPFFLYLPFLAPHYPNEAPASYVERYAHLPEPRRTYAAKVTALDDALGRVLDALDEADLADDTLVIFLSDNGANPNLGGSNAPLRGRKQEPFEGALRAPAAVRWPGRLAGGRELDAPLSYLDLFPTIARLAGADLRGLELDGRDALPVLRGAPPGASPPFFALAGNATSEFVVAVDGRWKLVRLGPSLLTDPEGGQLVLFDLETDPAETRDVSGENTEVVRRLLGEMRGFRALASPEGLVETLEPPPGWTAPVDWVVGG